MKIINKRKPNNWVKFDRSLMRDTRIKSHHKIIYLLFCSLSEACENVYPSYSWVAEEVGYNYTGKYEIGSKEYESALQQFVATNLEPLIKLGWIKKINNNGGTCDYEVFDHDCYPQEKSSTTPKKNLRGDPQEKSSIRYKKNKIEELGEGQAPQKQNSYEVEKEIKLTNKQIEYLELVFCNPLFEMLRSDKFPKLTNKEIELAILQYAEGKHQLQFNSFMINLERTNNDKIQKEMLEKKANKNKEWYDPEKTKKEKYTQIGVSGRSYLNNEEMTGFLARFDFDFDEENILNHKKEYEKQGYKIELEGY